MGIEVIPSLSRWGWVYDVYDTTISSMDQELGCSYGPHFRNEFWDLQFESSQNWWIFMKYYEHPTLWVGIEIWVKSEKYFSLNKILETVPLRWGLSVNVIHPPAFGGHGSVSEAITKSNFW